MPDISNIKRLFDEKDAAAILCVKVPTLRRWRWAGKGPRFLKLCGAVRYDPADLDTFIGEARRTSTSDDGTAAQAGDGGHGGD